MRKTNGFKILINGKNLTYEDNMSDFEDALVLGFGGLLGYGAAILKYSKWEPLIKDFEKRLNHLSYLKVTIPYKFFKINKNYGQLYSESVYAYLYGLSNASLPLILRCLETGLRNKYREVEKENPKKLNLNNLIDWAENYLRDKKEIAHGFRILRNLIHSEKLISEQDVSEALRHISIILNLLYELPKDTKLKVFCKNCNTEHQYVIQTHQYYIGNNMLFECDKFRQNINVIFIP